MARPVDYTLQSAAKMLGVGPNRLFRTLRERRVLSKDNIPYQRYIDQGYLKVNTGHFQHPGVGVKYYARVTVTNQGLVWLAKIVDHHGGTE